MEGRVMKPTDVRLLALKYALSLEIKGLKRSQSPSAYSIIKKEFGFKGSRERVLAQYSEFVSNTLG
jgi:hypothetical protein